MKTTKRKFSPAQLAAQKRFAAMAKAGTLKRKRRNTTIIKAKKISHLDVSKVHNGLASAKKRPIAKKRNAGYKIGDRVLTKYGKGQIVDIESDGRQLIRFDKTKEVDALYGGIIKKLPAAKRKNAEHRDAQHPIHVRDYWQGRRGYKSQWQRAHEAGQRQLFGVKNPSRDENLRLTFKGISSALLKQDIKKFEKILAVKGSLDSGDLHDYQILKAEINRRAKQKKNPRRGTRKLKGAVKRVERQRGGPYTAEQKRQFTAGWKTGRRQVSGAAKAKNPVFTVLGKVNNEYGTTWLTVKIPSAVNKLDALRLAKAEIKGTALEGRIKAWKVEKLSRNNTQLYASAKPKTRSRVNGKRLVSAVARRRNGANTSLARRRREEFVGRPSTQTKTLYAPAGSGASGTLSQLGKLHKIAIKGGKVYNFKGVPTLAQHPKTDQLFVLGKNYTVNAPKKNPGDRMVDLGEVKTIEYEAVKTHLGDTKPVRYYHHFGEEGGNRPHALVNEEGLIIFSGGDYYIRPEGIRD